MGSKVKIEEGVAKIRSDQIAVAFVGTVVPDAAEYRNPAFSPAGQMSQRNLLCGLQAAGLKPSLILSARPISSFPRGKKLWIGHSRVVLSGGQTAELIPFVNVTPIKQLAIGLSTFSRLVKWGWRNRSVVNRLVYTYNLTVPPGLLTLLAARVIGAKAAVSLYDINIPGQTISKSLLNRLDFWLHKQVIKRFDIPVTISDAIMRDFAPRKPYLRIEGGIADELFKDTEHRSQNLANPDYFTIVFAGSLDPVNGIDLMLQALARIEAPHFRLMIAGAGPQATDVLNAAERDHRIHYLGLLSFSALLQVYREADVLINVRPTKTMRTEYFFPSKFMEYLASGTPVISTCTGHTEEEFGHLCYLLKDETPEGLANLLQKVALMPIDERKRIGLRARAYMQQNKTWSSQGAKIVQFIDSVFSKSETSRKVTPIS